jgi:hypothetical protein
MIEELVVIGNDYWWRIEGPPLVRELIDEWEKQMVPK